jgi:glycosyltransferase involved in cell wall biosynthesis
MRIAALIPCLNEEISISRTIAAIKETGLEVDVYVIDNGSSDNTVLVAESSGARVLREPQRGKGFAIRRAFSKVPSDYDAFFMVDGDDTYGVESLSEAAHLVSVEGYDLVVGKRIVKDSVSALRKREFKFGHSLGNWLLSGTFKTLFRIPISDTLSGWRVMSPGYVQSFSGGASGFDIEAELNAHCYTIKAAVAEVSVTYQGRMEDSHSKLNTYRDGWIILRRNIRLYRAERPLIAYSILALPWALLSGILLYRVLGTYQEIGTVPRFPSLIAAVGLFIVACNLWVTGMILEKTRQIRVAIARSLYSRA